MSKSSSFTNLGVLKKRAESWQSGQLKKKKNKLKKNKQAHDPYIVDSRLRIDIKIQSYQMIPFKTSKIPEPKDSDRRYCTSTIMFRSVSLQIKVYCFYIHPAKLPGHFTENKQKTPLRPLFPQQERETWTQWVRRHCEALALGVRREHPWVRVAVGHGVHIDEWFG